MRIRIDISRLTFASAIAATAVSFLPGEVAAQNQSAAGRAAVYQSEANSDTDSVVVVAPDTQRQSTASRSSQIQLIQHQSRRNRGRADQTTGDSEKKRGFFKRLFSGIKKEEGETEGQSSDNRSSAGQQTTVQQKKPVNNDDNPYINSGQPVAKLPPPPAISYRTNSQTIYSSNGTANGIPAKPAGFSSDRTTPVIHSGAGRGYEQGRSAQQQQPQSQTGNSIPTLRQPGQSVNQNAAPRNDNFINPFVDEGSSPEVLDLDSIVTDPRGTGSNLKTMNPKEETLPELPAIDRKEATPRKEEPQSDSPYSGLRINPDEQLLIEPNTGSTVSTTNQSTEPEVIDKSDDVPLPLIEEDQADDLVEPELPVAPVEKSPAAETLRPIEEPKPAPATAEALLMEVEPEPESIPLLDESEIDFPAPDEVLDAPKSKEQSLPETSAATDTVEEAIEETAEEVSKADRLRALDSRAKQEQQRYRIMARSGQTGFKGFCPVSLRDSRELIDSRERYKAKFGLQTYYFCSPEAKSAFEADPARYAPAAGGSDVVLLVNTGEDVSGSLDFSLWYRDRLYMFRSRETQAIFAKDPTRFADQY